MKFLNFRRYFHPEKKTFGSKIQAQEAEVDFLGEFLEELVTKRHLSLQGHLAMIQIQLMKMRGNLTSLLASMQSLRKKIGKHADHDFDYFHIATLVKARVDSFYFGDVSQKDFENNTFPEVYADLNKDRELDRQESAFLDLTTVFSVKQRYETAVEGINDYLKTKTELFGSLLERTNYGTNFYYRLQRKLYQMGRSTDKQMLGLLSEDISPSYMLACATAYFLRVRYNSQVANGLFQRYRVMLQRQAVSGKNLASFTNDNMLQNSVASRSTSPESPSALSLMSLRATHRKWVCLSKDRKPSVPT